MQAHTDPCGKVSFGDALRQAVPFLQAGDVDGVGLVGVHDGEADLCVPGDLCGVARDLVLDDRVFDGIVRAVIIGHRDVTELAAPTRRRAQPEHLVRLLAVCLEAYGHLLGPDAVLVVLVVEHLLDLDARGRRLVGVRDVEAGDPGRVVFDRVLLEGVGDLGLAVRLVLGLAREGVGPVVLGGDRMGVDLLAVCQEPHDDGLGPLLPGVVVVVPHLLARDGHVLLPGPLVEDVMALVLDAVVVGHLLLDHEIQLLLDHAVVLVEGQHVDPCALLGKRHGRARHLALGVVRLDGVDVDGQLVGPALDVCHLRSPVVPVLRATDDALGIEVGAEFETEGEVDNVAGALPFRADDRDLVGLPEQGEVAWREGLNHHGKVVAREQLHADPHEPGDHLGAPELQVEACEVIFVHAELGMPALGQLVEEVLDGVADAGLRV